MQIAHRDGDLIRHLNEGDQIHQVDTIELQCLLQRSLRGELTLFNLKLLCKHAVYLLNNFFSCHNFII